MFRFKGRRPYLATFVNLFVIGSLSFYLSGCIALPPQGGVAPEAGGYDGTVIDLPFAEGYESLCTQGPYDTYSHDGESTALDLDFDTPNGDNDLVFAPIGGTAYVHTESASRNFGYHVNIDLGDNTYVVLAHLSDVFVSDGAEVAAGQILGYEGCTGNCSGDHVHIGLHDGDASLMAEYGDSIEVGYFVDDVSTGAMGAELGSEDFVCGTDGGGHTYASLLPVTNWHPNGTLVKTPDDNNVYLVEDGGRRWIETEDVFWDAGFDFSEVVLISAEELDCMDALETIDEVGDVHFQIDNAYVRDGDLVREASRSDVYVIADGMAVPIETWEIFLRLGFGSRTIKTVDDGTIANLGIEMGSCSADYACIDADLIETCGGSVAGVGGSEGGDTFNASADAEDTQTEENDTTHDDTSGTEDGQQDSGSGQDTSTDEEDSEDDGNVTICYLPGTAMEDGELYLDGLAFTYWGSPVADDADSGDVSLCADVPADSGEIMKMNAWYQTTSGGEVYWAAYNDNCTSIDFRGTVQVDGVSMVVVASPWSEEAWESDPCAIGGDAYFQIP